MTNGNVEEAADHDNIGDDNEYEEGQDGCHCSLEHAKHDPQVHLYFERFSVLPIDDVVVDGESNIFDVGNQSDEDEGNEIHSIVEPKSN